MKNNKQVKRIYRGSTWRLNQKKKETQKLYWKIISWVTIVLMAGIAGTWNHYTLEYKKLSVEAIEAINSNIHVEKVKAVSLQIPEVTNGMRDEKNTRAKVEATAKKVCSERNLGDYCWKDLMGIAYAESRTTNNPVTANFNCNVVGDNGKAFGCFQIHQGFGHNVTVEQSKDIEFAIKWTLNRMQGYGYPEYRSYAVMKHNGTPNTAKTKAYLATVNNFVNSLK